MKVIHDDETGGLMMIPLLLQWRIPETCEIKDCEEKSNAIYIFTAGETPAGTALHVGVCENHHQESTSLGTFNYTIRASEEDSNQP